MSLVFCFCLIYFFICLLFSCLPFYQPFVHLIRPLKKTVTTTTTKTTTKRITISCYRTSLVNEKTIKQFYSKKYMLSTVIAIIKSITVTISQNDIKYYLRKKGQKYHKTRGTLTSEPDVKTLINYLRYKYGRLSYKPKFKSCSFLLNF